MKIGKYETGFYLPILPNWPSIGNNVSYNSWLPKMAATPKKEGLCFRLRDVFGQPLGNRAGGRIDATRDKYGRCWPGHLEVEYDRDARRHEREILAKKRKESGP